MSSRTPSAAPVSPRAVPWKSSTAATTAARTASTNSVIFTQLYGREPTTAPVRALTRTRYGLSW